VLSFRTPRDQIIIYFLSVGAVCPPCHLHKRWVGSYISSFAFYICEKINLFHHHVYTMCHSHTDQFYPTKYFRFVLFFQDFKMAYKKNSVYKR